MKHILISILLLSLLTADAAEQPTVTTRPNIIFILADDLGIDGVSCYGADARKTPEIDKLAASGMRFDTCYAAPLCGPSRCVLMTGRYAFRTGGLLNASWRARGPGAKAADEQPIAKMMKRGGYVTGMAGKWRQLGETPREWGFDEYTTDETPSGWYWQTKYFQNGVAVTKPPGTYAPNVIQEFTVDFIRRHRDQPFFFYYSMHLVHKPTQHTPDSPKGVKEGVERYNDNIAYMDKQVGGIVAELKKLGLSEKTLVIFAGDNGTANLYPAPVHGRMLNGQKATMLEGGSRVPFIASWPGTTPAGKVSPDIVSFVDPHATFMELAGVKPPVGFKLDGHSYAPQLRGEPGTAREWAYVQLGAHWFVREPGFKLNEAGGLFDMSDAPFVEKLVAPESDTKQSKAARARLTAVLAELNPAAGRTDAGPGQKSLAAGSPAQAVTLQKESPEPDGSEAAPAARLAKKKGMPSTLTRLGDVGEPTRRVVYKTVGERKLELHIFEPPGHKPSDRRTCFVTIHGGGWVGGQPSRFYPFAAHLAKLGCVGISVQYRLVNKAADTSVFDCVKDGRSAIRYLRQHADELGIDPQKIVVSGGSAGGHVAAATALFEGIDEPGDEMKVSSVPNALVLYFPVIDTSQEGYGNAKCGERWQEISPLHRVKAGAPPTLILHGTADTTTPFKGAKAFEEAMHKAGNRCELIAHEGCKHGYLLAGPALFNQAMQQTEDFLRSLKLLDPAAKQPGQP